MNDPVNFVDPSGLVGQVIHNNPVTGGGFGGAATGVGAAAAAAASAASNSEAGRCAKKDDCFAQFLKRQEECRKLPFPQDGPCIQEAAYQYEICKQKK